MVLLRLQLVSMLPVLPGRLVVVVVAALLLLLLLLLLCLEEGDQNMLLYSRHLHGQPLHEHVQQPPHYMRTDGCSTHLTLPWLLPHAAQP
jgi:hypothetical protein